MRSNVSDEIQSGDNEFSISVQLMNDVDEPKTADKPEKFSKMRKVSDDIVSYSTSVREFTGYNSNKNILRVRDLNE